MTRPLENVTVAITEHRYTKEFAKLFERFGAEVYVCPLMEERPVQNRDEVQEFIRLITSGSFDMMIFLTGVGARFLLAEAESMGCKSELLAALQKLTIVARGPKPVTALHQAGIKVDIMPNIPTSAGIVETLAAHDLGGKRVGLQLYGVPNPDLCSALIARGADIRTVQVYNYGSASDRTAINALVEKLLGGQIEVITFTSAFQVHFLFEAADGLGSGSDLTNRLNSGTIVASIGDVTTRALGERGVAPKITPKEPKMASLVNAIAEFFEKRSS
jgi:uroporphyrinogen-III synthase